MPRFARGGWDASEAREKYRARIFKNDVTVNTRANNIALAEASLDILHNSRMRIRLHCELTAKWWFIIR